MKKGKGRNRPLTIKKPEEDTRKEISSLRGDLDYFQKHIDKLWENSAETKERLQDLEIQTNLITRLIAALCMEVMKIPSKTFRGIVRQVEQDAERDSQVVHLEELFRMESKKKDEEDDPA